MPRSRPRRTPPALTPAENQVVTWAVAHGAPVRILEGWDPEAGTWLPTSPIGQVLAAIQTGMHPNAAARLVGIPIASAVQRGHEFAIDAAEDRRFIDRDLLVFIDLVRAVQRAEAVHEVTLIRTVNRGSLEDPKLALQMLGRRYPERWREQTQVLTGESDIDPHAVAVQRAISDPAIAMQLAEIADAIEDDTPVEQA